MQQDLHIHLLGSFRLFVKGIAVAKERWEKRRARLLLQILALHPLHEMHREELIEQLFPETNEKTANDNFYRLLHAARRALEPNRGSYASSKYLLTEGQQIMLAAEMFWIDAEEFKTSARTGLKTNDQVLLESAAELYRGDLLANEPFEELFANPRRELRSLFHRVLRRLAEIAEKHGELEECHYWLDKILQHEPVDETVHRSKMRLYEKQGDRSLALRQYENCYEALKRELSIEPDDETEELRRKILQQKGK